MLRRLADLARGLDFQDEPGPDAGVTAYRASGSGGPHLAAALADIGGGAAAIDVGCAKGSAIRTLLGFYERVDGIELDARLAAVCRRNMRRLGAEERVEVTTGDALAFDGYGRYELVYLYNPFPADVMEQLVPLLGRGRVLYNNPTAGVVLERAGWRRVREWPNGHEWQGRPTVVALFEH